MVAAISPTEEILTFTGAIEDDEVPVVFELVVVESTVILLKKLCIPD